MTKKTDTVSEAEENSNSDALYHRAYTETRDMMWTRRDALEQAINFHKNNGGMLSAEQLLENAKKFLAFTQGETSE